MNNILDQQHQSYSRELTVDFFKSVYSYMFLALVISGGVAYYVGGNAAIFDSYFVKPEGGLSPLFYVVLFTPFVLSMIIQWAYNRLSMIMLTTLYITYAAFMGLMLSVVFLTFSMQSIAITFFVSAGAFGGMAIMGYTTKTDLTKFGSLLYMVFIGMFLAIIVNIFMKSDMLDFVISIVGVFVFTGLTAYWMQQLKTAAQDTLLSSVERQKLALVGGMTLYILFINLFLTLLRLVGSRD
ncbi:MAG: Bax inhibitor-1/YccA family protein [Crocinitomicaceae bacterium]|nr:MAG: Bax inhibitor-1/YccA family protein [Crocinitomicaceae bacterium]